MTPAAEDTVQKVDAYIAAAPESMQGALRRMRELIRTAAPQALETFGYGLPGFKYLGRPLLYYGAAQKHYGLYGAGASLLRAAGEDPSTYDTSKGTIRFKPEETPPESLVTRLVEARVAENETFDRERKARARARRGRATTSRP